MPCLATAGLAIALLIAPCVVLAQSEKPSENNAGQQAGPVQPPDAPARKEAPKQSSSQPSAEAPSQRRLWFGGLASYTPFKLIQGGTTSPSSTTTSSAQSGNRPVGEGFTFHAHLFRRFSLAADFVHRGAEYNGSTAVAGKPTTTSTTSTTVTGITYEITNATYWDLPVLLEYQPAHRWYYEGGVSMRRVSDILSWRYQRSSSAVTTTSSGSVATTNTDTCCDETPAAAHNNIVGMVAGIGMHVREPMGLKVTPEIRFTRWLGSTFDVGAAHSSHNQVEILLGLAF